MSTYQDFENEFGETAEKNAVEEIFGEPIYAYTAEQAVEDGILVDVSAYANEVFTIGCDMKWKTRVTRKVFDACTPPKSNKIESFDGRIHDVLWMCKLAMRAADKGDNFVAFTVKIGRKNHRLWAVLDITSGPAIHIMYPEEY